jgi:hypothetical protein
MRNIPTISIKTSWIRNCQTCVYARIVTRGRFRDEVNLAISLKGEGMESHLLYIKVFYGRKPFYRAWVEFFNIAKDVSMGDEELKTEQSRTVSGIDLYISC